MEGKDQQGNGKTLAVHEFKIDELQRSVDRLEAKLDSTLEQVTRRLNDRATMCVQHDERLRGIAEWQGRTMGVLLLVVGPLATALLAHILGRW